MEKGTDVREMEDRLILREGLLERGMTQMELANKMGLRQSTLSANMTRHRMSLDNFGKILDELEYDVVVVDRRTGEAKWMLAKEL